MTKLSDREIDSIKLLAPQDIREAGTGKVAVDRERWLKLLDFMSRTIHLLEPLGKKRAAGLSGKLNGLTDRFQKAVLEVREATEPVARAVEDGAQDDSELGNQAERLADAWVSYLLMRAEILEFMKTTFAPEVNELWAERTANLIAENFANEFPGITGTFDNVRLTIASAASMTSLIPIPGVGLAINAALNKAVDGCETAVSGLISNLGSYDPELQKKYAQYKTAEELKGISRGEIGEKIHGIAEGSQLGLEVASKAGALSDAADPALVATGMAATFGGISLRFMKRFEDTRNFYSPERRNPKELVVKYAESIDKCRKIGQGDARFMLAAENNVVLHDQEGDGRWIADVNGVRGHFSEDFRRWEADNQDAYIAQVRANAARECSINPPWDRSGGNLQQRITGAKWFWHEAQYLGQAGEDTWTFRVTMQRKIDADSHGWRNWNPESDPFRGSFDFILAARLDGHCEIIYPLRVTILTDVRGKTATCEVETLQELIELQKKYREKAISFREEDEQRKADREKSARDESRREYEELQRRAQREELAERAKPRAQKKAEAAAQNAAGAEFIKAETKRMKDEDRKLKKEEKEKLVRIASGANFKAVSVKRAEYLKNLITRIWA